jgi:hypothetical protein
MSFLLPEKRYLWHSLKEQFEQLLTNLRFGQNSFQMGLLRILRLALPQFALLRESLKHCRFL